MPAIFYRVPNLRIPTGIDWAEAIRAGRDERDRELIGGVLRDDPEP